MHLSDGFLDVPTAFATSAVAAGSIGVSLWQLRRDGESLPSAGRMAVVGAAVFAAQAIDFPIADGISGHLLGGVAAAAVLGPWAGMLVISAVLAVQCVLLGDGGLSALGANVLNMAVLGSLLGWPVWKISRGAATPARRAAAAALAGAAALPLGAVACAIEMHAAGRADFTATVGRMIPLHLILGVAEGLFTAAAVWAMAKKPTVMAITMRRNVLAVSSIIAIVAVLAPFSSALPDTLEAAVESLGVASSEPLSGAAVDAAAFAFVGTWAATTLPIVLGTLIAVAAVVLLERGLSRSAVKAPRRRDVR